MPIQTNNAKIYISTRQANQYNVQNSIQNTINSLLNQSDIDFEIILVNDGPTDNTFEVVEDILSKSNFTNYKIINKENGGVSSARNVGIRES